jgi:hypothetical protein
MGEGRGEGERNESPPPLSSPEMWEEGKRLIPRDVGGEEKHGIIIIKDEIVGAIHKLPLRNTN